MTEQKKIKTIDDYLLDEVHKSLRRLELLHDDRSMTVMKVHYPTELKDTDSIAVGDARRAMEAIVDSAPDAGFVIRNKEGRINYPTTNAVILEGLQEWKKQMKGDK